jgi:hypothetical protein
VEDKTQNTNVTFGNSDGGGQPIEATFGVAPEPINSDPNALSLDPTSLAEPPPDDIEVRKEPSKLLRFFKRADVILALLVVSGAAIALVLSVLNRTDSLAKNSATDITERYGSQRIPLDTFQVPTGEVPIVPTSVTINGSLRVTDGLVIAPSVQPNAPTSGQLYFDTNTNQLAYYNGTGYVALTEQGAVVQSIGGATGPITLGGGLSVVGNQLSVAFPQATVSGVSSVGGATGAITLGSGLEITGNTVRANGVLTLTAGTPNLIVNNDGSGNLTISNVGGGSGTVTSSGGSAGRIAKFTGVQNLEDSLLSESGGTVTTNGNLAVTGALALASALTVGNGGVGTNILPNNAVLIGQGTDPVAGVSAAGAGLCLVSTAGAPTFTACPSGNGVLTLNGLTGALTIANATGTVNTITIDDAGTSTKGIASFNGANFSVTGGAVNTIQNIGTGATPTFAGVNTNTITPSAAMTIGIAGQTLSMVGGSGSTFTASGGAGNTTLGFSGTPTGAVTYNLDRAAAPGAYTICTTAANCAGLGGTVTTTGGTTDRLSKFTGGQIIGDSSLSDDGTTVIINGTANLVVQGGTTTVGTLTQAGQILLSDGSSNTVTIAAASLSANRTYTLPDAGGDATLCVNSGNCIGGTGSAPNTAAYLVTSLDGTLTNERAISAGNNVELTDGGAGSTMTIATVANPVFNTSVTTPLLQSSGALSLTSASGAVTVDASTTIELQDSTNITGSLDISVALNVGTGDAFQVNATGAVAAATGITSSGAIIFSDLDCTGNGNGGVLTTNGSGQLICDDDDGGSGTGVSGTGTAGAIPVFNGTQSITNSIITQSGTTISVAGDLVLSTDLSVSNGGTGASSFTTRGLLYGNGSGALQVTAAGTGGQVVIADGSGVPTFTTFSGDVTVSSAGGTAIQPNSVALSTDTTGDYIANLGTLTGLSTGGNSGEGSTPSLSVVYGALANTAVQGNVTLACTGGSGNLTGGGNSVTLGSGGSCGAVSIVDNPSFATSVTAPAMVLTGAGQQGTIEVGNLGQGTVYTLPDPGAAAATICISTGNCATAGTAGGDLTGTYPNPTIAKLQNTNLTITAPSAGHILVYNATSGAWENRLISGDIAISETGVATVQANAVALGADTAGNYVLGLSAGNGVSVTGSAGEGWTPTVSVLYGSSANTAVEGNTGITVTAGTNLTGGGSITLGAGGTVTLNVANSPTFSGTLAVQGASVTVGGAAQAGSVVLNDGSSNTGSIQTGALGQNTAYTLPDPGAGSATICLSTGNCAGSGGGVTSPGGTTDRLSKFTGAQAIADSSISDDGSVVTINGTANFVVQGGTATLGTLTQAGTLAISDGSSNTVSIVASGLSANRTYTLPDAGGPATFCLSTGNCLGGGGGSAPNDAAYLVATLNGTLTNERALANGTNITIADGGAGGSLTVATVNNPTFSTSVTTPALQSSGALVISSAAGQTVAIDAGTTIELQDSTNITGSLDVSVALNVGTSNAFQVSSGGAVAAATGITSSGTITFSGLNCTTFANGGSLTTNASGVLTCADDDGGAGGAITGSGTAGTIPIFSTGSSIGDSIITQASTTITIAGTLELTNDLSVSNGGTGAGTFTTRGLLYGNGTGAIQATAAGTSGQVLVANASGVPTFVSFTGDVAVSDTGATTIQANSVALGGDTTGSYVANLGTLTGLSTSGNSGEGSTPTLSVTYGSSANTAVQGNVSLTCGSGSGNLTGGGNSITLGSGGTCGAISIVNSPAFTTSVTTPLLTLTGAGSNGTLQVANLGQTTTYTLPDPGAASASICLSTGNCTSLGTAGGDLTGSFPNPTIASLQGTTLTITSVASGNILQYDGSAWVNRNITGDIALNSSGVSAIQANAVTSGKISDGTIANGDLASGTFSNITGVGTLGALTVVGATSVNASGTANTTIGNATGTFQLDSSALDISTAGALSGVTGITTSGGYIQSGSTANTLTGATTFSAAGTALTVTNNASVGGTLAVNTITPSGALTIGSTGQSFTLQGGATSTITATNGANVTTLGFVTPTANTTLNFPALAAGTYTICTTSGNCAGAGVTLQTAYNLSTNPEITLDATRGALTVRDNSTPLSANLLEVQSNNGSTTYFNVTSSGVNITGTAVTSGNINTTGGGIQTSSTTRLDGSGNLLNIADITASGTATISTAVRSPSLDTSTAANLNIGATNASAVNIGRTGSNAQTSIYGPVLSRPVTDTTTAFRMQNASQTAIFNLDTTSNNLITNSTFESLGTTGWVAHNGASISQSILAHYDNDGSLDIDATAANHGARYPFALAASTQYSFSVFVRAATASFATVQLGYSNNGSTDTSCATAQQVYNGQWVRLTCTFTTAGSVSGTRYVYVKQTDAASRSFWIDATQLETAAAPTTYRNGKLSLAGSMLINGGPLDATANTSALYVNALGGGNGITVRGAGDNNLFTNLLDVRTADDSLSLFHVNEVARQTDVSGGSGFLATAALNVTTVDGGAQALRVSGAGSATAPVAVFRAGATPGAGGQLLALQDSGSLTHAFFNNIGNELNLGRVASSGTVSQGKIILADGTTDNFGLTLQSATLTNNRTITLPDATGTVCLNSSTSCGFASNLQTAYNLSTDPELVVNTTNGALSVRQDAAAAVTTLFEVTNNGGNNPFLRVDTGGIFVSGNVNAATGIMIAGTFRSSLQTAASTNSQNTLLGSGGVSGATSNSGTVTLQSGGSTTSGNTGDVFIQSGGATSGNSGNITIDVGSASGTRGTLTVGSTNTTGTISIGTNANQVVFGSAGTMSASTFTFGNGIQGSLILMNPTVDSTHVQHVISKRSDNLNLWQYAYDGTTFWNYLQTDWATKELILNNHTGGNTRIGSTSGASAVNVRSGTGGTSFDTNGASAGVAIRTNTNSTQAFQVQNASSYQVFNISTNGNASNLVTNGGFENNVALSWSQQNGTATVTRNTTQKYAQTASMLVAISTTEQYDGVKFPVTLTPSTTYAFSFYAKLSSSAAPTPSIVFGYSNTGVIGGESDCVSDGQPFAGTSTWVRFSCTFTTPASNSGSPYMYIEQNTAHAYSFYVDNVLLVQQSSQNQAYYDGTLDMSGAAINGPVTIQNTSDSTAALQVFGGQVIYGNLTTYSTDMTKAYRFRTSGGSLDLETSGNGVSGEMWISGWTGQNFTGTQINFLRMSADARLVMVGSGTNGPTPVLLELDDKSDSATDPSGTDGSMYYNSFSDEFRCRINGTWYDCVAHSETTAASGLSAGGSTTSSSYATMPTTSSVAITKRSPATKLLVTINTTAYISGTFNTATTTSTRFAARVAGTDYDCINFFFNAQGVHTQISCSVLISGVASGAQTVDARWRRVSGTGTLQQDTNDWTTVTVQEVD